MHNASRTTFRITSLLAATVMAVSASEHESPLRSAPNFLPADVEQILAEGEFELISLDPTLLTDKQRRRLRTKLFHGYRVLGRVKIQKGPQRDQLLQALHQAIANSSGAYVYCFDPRHAIRASVGTRTVDLAICFACEMIMLYPPGKSLANTNATAEPAFDATLKRAGIPLGKRP
ncbi:MAG: hypothetical protein QOE26_2863 [Verrucomicrobiota bacterium]|jgi:hypothetical protein